MALQPLHKAGPYLFLACVLLISYVVPSWFIVRTHNLELTKALDVLSQEYEDLKKVTGTEKDHMVEEKDRAMQEKDVANKNLDDIQKELASVQQIRTEIEKQLKDQLAAERGNSVSIKAKMEELQKQLDELKAKQPAEPKAAEKEAPKKEEAPKEEAPKKEEEAKPAENKARRRLLWKNIGRS